MIESVERQAGDSEVVLQLEHYVVEWSQVLASVMQRESEKQPIGKGPLAEIEFWRARNAVLSSIYEQLNLPNVRTATAAVAAVATAAAYAACGRKCRAALTFPSS